MKHVLFKKMIRLSGYSKDFGYLIVDADDIDELIESDPGYSSIHDDILSTYTRRPVVYELESHEYVYDLNQAGRDYCDEWFLKLIQEDYEALARTMNEYQDLRERLGVPRETDEKE